MDISLDFTQEEQTRKSYNPADLPAVRSEMTVEDNNVGNGAMGIPGALSNQPPLNSDIPQQATNTGAQEKQINGRSRKVPAQLRAGYTSVVPSAAWGAYVA